MENLYENIHLNLKPPTENGKSYLIKGNFIYYHYNCDGFKDSGWGCGYRTLQSMCSWIKNTLNSPQEIPTIPEIQKLLIDMGDKPSDFLNSHDWIGALEVFYVIDTLFDVSCRILHISKQEDVKKFIAQIKNYFCDFGGLIMMGGDLDCASKGICGVHICGNDAYLLLVDPHFQGKVKTREDLQRMEFIKWQNATDFCDSSFYNLCMPQLKFNKND